MMMENNDLDPQYTETCSFRTIQSDEKGFFNEFYESVLRECNEKWLKDIFGYYCCNKNNNIDGIYKENEENVIEPSTPSMDTFKTVTNNDRRKLTLLFNEPKVCDILLGTLEHVQPIYKMKNATVSRQRRIEAEKFLTNKEYDKALILFGQAVLRAPMKGVELQIDGGLSLALALWSRSALFLELHDGINAINDLQFALKNGLPGKQHGDYYGRLAKANALNGEKGKSIVCLNLAERFIQDVVALDRLKEDLRNIGEINKIDDSNLNVVPELTNGENEELPEASKSITLCRSTENDGNFIVAKNKISTGDILLTEQPLAACLLPKFFGVFCLHCFKTVKCSYGCPSCSGVAFCSVNCLTIACSTYHKFECKFMDLLIGSGMSILCFVALRIITQSCTPSVAIKNGRKIINELCSHSNLRKPNDYLQRCIMAAFLTRVLQKSDFFGYRKTEAPNLTSIEMDICEILLGLLQVLQFNAHEIYETKFGDKHKFTGSKHINIAVALYKTGALFNHNCCPSVTRYFNGKTIILRATHPIEPGEYIGENYGPIYSKFSLKERQRTLRSRYWFTCKCVSCRENWKLLDKLTNKARLRCPTTMCNNIHNYPENPRKSLNCTKCRKTISLQENVIILMNCEEIYRKAAEFMEVEDIDNAISKLTEGINLFYTIAIPPHKDTQIAQESLRACFAAKGSIFNCINSSN